MRTKPLRDHALAASTATLIERLERRALLSAAGSLDQLFGVGGKVTTELIASSWDGADAVALQPDGKVLVGGRSSAGGAFVLRYLPDGSPDPAFGNGGKAELGHDRTVADLALDSIGRIIVGGSYHDDPDDKQFAVTRLTPSGSPDASFDGDGLAIKAFTAGDDEINALAIDAQDRILAVGSAGSQLAYVRFGADGVPDAQFLRYALPITGAAAQRIALQPDGKAVIAGLSPLGLVVLRLNPQGTLDDSFGTSGVATTTIPALSGARSLIVQEDGRIIVGADVAYEAGDFAIARFLADGEIDTSFDADGTVSTSFGDGVASRVRSVLLLPGGKILAIGEADHAEFAVQLAAALYHADGTPDLSFGQGSGLMVRAHPSNIPFVVADAVLQPDGQVLVAGATYTQMTDMDVLLARYAMTFDADASFGDGGHVRTDFQGPVVTQARGTAVGPDGSIVVTGVSLDAVAVVVAKYRPDGTPDTEFGGTGIVRTGFGRSFFGADVASVVAVQDDGKIVVAGHSFGNTIRGIDRPQLALARYSPDGALDSSFGDGGLVLIDATGGYGVASIAIQPDGKIIVGSVADYGTEDADIAILRFNGDGSPDESFGTGGMARVDYGGYEDSFGSLSLQPDGKIVVAGSYWVSRTDAATLTRLLPDGSLDAAFGSGGRVSVDFSDDQYAGDQFFDVGLYRNGDILAAARSGSDVILMRYGAADGLVDDSFGVGGRMTVPLAPGVSITRVLLQPDGKLLLAGRIGASADGRSGGDFFAARLNPDGTTDTTFSEDGQAAIDFSEGSDTLADALLLPTGGIVMAGSTRDTRDTNFALAKLVNDAFVTGTDGDDTVRVEAGDGQLRIFVNADPGGVPTHAYPLDSMDRFVIDLRGGDDVITVVGSPDLPRASLLGGDGDDRLLLTGAGAPAQLVFEAGAGSDQLELHAAASPPQPGETYPVHYDGGGGFDELLVRGTDGDDQLSLVVAFSTGVRARMDANGHHVTLAHADDGRRVEAVHVQALDGDDAITLDGEAGILTVAADAGAGDDTLTLASRNDYPLDLVLGRDAADNDTLVVDGDRFRFGYDLGTLSPNLRVKFDAFIVNLDVPQHVDALDVAGRTIVSLNTSGGTGITVGDFSMSPDAMMDLSRGDLLVHADPAEWQSARDHLEERIGAARNSPRGLWSGAGISASQGARTNPLKGLAVYAEYAPGAAFVPIRVKFTWNGDANLDGAINADDYFRIDQGFLARPQDPLYAQGDFNYDGLVNADDYFLIDQAFLGQSPVAQSSPSSIVPATASPGPRRAEPPHRPFNAVRLIRPR